MINTFNDAVLIRSENCNYMVEDHKKTSEKSIYSLLTTVGIIGVLIMFSPNIIAFLEDKNMSQAGSVPFPIVLLVLAMVIVVWVVGMKSLKKERELYNEYREYCATEVLVADKTKIYGSTTRGAITLTYAQIESVRFSPNTWSPSEKKPVIQNDILTIHDVAGNTFVFYSFSNCKDLKTVIDMQMRSVWDGKM